MELSGSERAEFIALTQDSYDPDLWDEADYWFLKAARAACEREQARERSGVSPVVQPNLMENDEAMPDPSRAADDL